MDSVRLTVSTGRVARLPARVGAVAALAAMAVASMGFAHAADLAPQAAATLRFNGVLKDTSFASGLPVRLEVLETGDTLATRSGVPFTARLPRDTIWNLCFSAAAAMQSGGAAADSAFSAAAASAPNAAGARLEKCYEIRYQGADSAFSAEIGEGPAVVVEAPSEAGPSAVAAAQDSVAADTATASFQSDEAVTLKKVLVRAQRAPKRSLGKSTVSAKLIKRMPGLAEADVIRSIQALPGVVASSDFSTKIYVRGGGSDQNLILLDRAVVYSPVHFFGLFSTFLVEGIDEVNFYKGGFPPEFGNRLSSVLDIKSREGGKDTVDSWFKGSSVKISTFASQLHTEGRQGPVRWLVAGRRTYLKEVLRPLARPGPDGTEPQLLLLRSAGQRELRPGQGQEHDAVLVQRARFAGLQPLQGGVGQHHHPPELLPALVQGPGNLHHRVLQPFQPELRARQAIRVLQPHPHRELQTVPGIHRHRIPPPHRRRGLQLDGGQLHQQSDHRQDKAQGRHRFLAEQPVPAGQMDRGTGRNHLGTAPDPFHRAGPARHRAPAVPEIQAAPWPVPGFPHRVLQAIPQLHPVLGSGEPERVLLSRQEGQPPVP